MPVHAYCVPSSLGGGRGVINPHENAFLPEPSAPPDIRPVLDNDHDAVLLLPVPVPASALDDSFFFFQNFNPRRRLRDRDSRTARSPLRTVLPS